MGRISSDTAHKILEFNREALYHIPAEYEYIKKYLVGSLRETLFSVLRYLSNKEIIIYRHRYEFILDNKKLTYGVRKKAGGEGTTSRHVNMLCAMGFFTKREQSNQSDELLDGNRDYKNRKPKRRRYINVYSFRKYDRKELKRIEERSKRLSDAGVTPGNFSYNMLSLHGLTDLAREVLPANNWGSPGKKLLEYKDLWEVMDFIVRDQGYATRQQVQDNLLISDKEVAILFKLFKNDIATDFFFKRPTKKQMIQFGLKSLKYIYMMKEE